MITDPKTFFEQFQNFIEESGLQLKKFKSNLSNYFTKSEAIDTFLGKTAKAESAKTADTATTSVTATKATQDASGNIITSTYATKAEVAQGLAGKANASHTHTIANVTGLQADLTTIRESITNVSSKVENVQAKVEDKLGVSTVHIIGTWKSFGGNSWYRVWSDGWVEQGGHGTGDTCIFNKPFSNIEYTFNVQPSSGYTSHPDWIAAYENRPWRTTTGTRVSWYSGGDQGWDWRASGY